MGNKIKGVNYPLNFNDDYFSSSLLIFSLGEGLPSSSFVIAAAFSLTAFSISSATFGFFSKYNLAFSFPCPIFSPFYAYQAPDFSMMSALAPRSINSPFLLIPLPYIKSNSTTLKGGATLFLITFTLVVFPMI